MYECELTYNLTNTLRRVSDEIHDKRAASHVAIVEALVFECLDDSDFTNQKLWTFETFPECLLDPDL